MSSPRAHHHSVHRPHSPLQRLYADVLLPLGLLVLTVVLLHTYGERLSPEHETLGYVLAALVATSLRLLAAYGLALLAAYPLALLVTHNETTERIFLPIFDIMESLPVLAFFPVIIVFFVHWGFYNGAAIFVLFAAMLWNMVFSLVGGIRAIPQDIKAAGRVFGLRGLAYARAILLPASVPALVTGSLLAFAQGWNIIIVAEVLHNYFPAGSTQGDLFGIGSLLVSAAASGAEQIFLIAIVVLIVAIALLNLFVWQTLLRYAEKFKFE